MTPSFQGLSTSVRGLSVRLCPWLSESAMPAPRPAFMQLGWLLSTSSRSIRSHLMIFTSQISRSIFLGFHHLLVSYYFPLNIKTNMVHYNIFRLLGTHILNKFRHCQEQSQHHKNKYLVVSLSGTKFLTTALHSVTLCQVQILHHKHINLPKIIYLGMFWCFIIPSTHLTTQSKNSLVLDYQ